MRHRREGVGCGGAEVTKRASFSKKVKNVRGEVCPYTYFSFTNLFVFAVLEAI